MAFGWSIIVKSGHGGRLPESALSSSGKLCIFVWSSSSGAYQIFHSFRNDRWSLRTLGPTLFIRGLDQPMLFTRRLIPLTSISQFLFLNGTLSPFEIQKYRRHKLNYLFLILDFTGPRFQDGTGLGSLFWYNSWFSKIFGFWIERLLYLWW